MHSKTLISICLLTPLGQALFHSMDELIYCIFALWAKSPNIQQLKRHQEHRNTKYANLFHHKIIFIVLHNVKTASAQMPLSLSLMCFLHSLMSSLTNPPTSLTLSWASQAASVFQLLCYKVATSKLQQTDLYKKSFKVIGLGKWLGLESGVPSKGCQICIQPKFLMRVSSKSISSM